MLVASGYQGSIPTPSLTKESYHAIKKFSDEQKYKFDRLIPNADMLSLIRKSESLLNKWKFERVSHPWGRRPLWIPMGITSNQEITSDGLIFSDSNKRTIIAYNYFNGKRLKHFARRLLSAIKRNNEEIIYTATTESKISIFSLDADGKYKYVRYYQDKYGIIGFTFVWNKSDTEIYGQRIATLMSASLVSSVYNQPTLDPKLYRTILTRITNSNEKPDP